MSTDALRPSVHAPEPAPKCNVSSLDFERIVNQYSIQAARDLGVSTFPPNDDEKEEWNQEGDDLLSSRNGHKERNQNYTGDVMRHPNGHGTTLQQHPKKTVTKSQRQSTTDPSGTVTTRPKRYASARTCTRWFLTLLTGVSVGLTAIIIVSCTDMLTEWRSQEMDQRWAVDMANTSHLAFFYTAFNLVLAMISAITCLLLAPEAVGSGIPEVKAYLNGVRAPNLGGVTLFLVKIFATVLSVSSGLVCGPEGPFIHIGAIIGTSSTQLVRFLQHVLRRLGGCCSASWREKLGSWIDRDLSHFSCDAERRDLVSIGAAAGFAAAFGAPIGGLLFAAEEASTFFGHSMFVRTLSATAVGTFCVAIRHGDLSEYSVINLRSFHSNDTEIFVSRFVELPLYVLVAAAGGLIGAWTVQVWKAKQLAKRRLYGNTKNSTQVQWQLAEVAILSLVTSAVTFYLATRPWACKGIALNDDLVSNPNPRWAGHEHQVLCPEGHLNEVAAILFGGRDAGIRAILTDPSQFDPRTLLAVGLTFLPLMTFTLGVALPSGIFMPAVLIGCALGGYVGLLFEDWISPDVSPNTFALLGAAALLAGIQRSTVSLCVILVEGTGQTKVLIPVIVTVVVARYVGDMVAKHGLYEVGIEIKSYPYLEHEEVKHYDVFDVGNIMSAPPRCLNYRETASTIARLLEESTHNGFPVIDKSVEGDEGRFLGLVRRDQLVALLECGIFMTPEEMEEFAEVEQFQPGTPRSGKGGVWGPPPGVSKNPMMNLAFHIKDDRYQDVTEAASQNLAEEYDQVAWVNSIRKHYANLDAKGLPPIVTESMQANIKGARGYSKTRYGWVGTNAGGLVAVRLNPTYATRWVNIAAVMNRGTYTVTEFCPVSKALNMFTALGLRHLVVLGGSTGGSVVGILTRANLLPARIESLYGTPAEADE
jgi:H+/Cl- antiporter ClcA